MNKSDKKLNEPIYYDKKINSRKEIIETISKNAFNSKGRLKLFTEQLEDYRKGLLKTSDNFVLSSYTTHSLYFAGIKDLPIGYSKHSLEHTPKHFETFNISRLNDINKLFKNTVIALKDKTSKHKGYKTIIIKDTVIKNNYILVGIFDSKNVGGRNYINDIRTIYNVEYIKEYIDKRINRNNDWEYAKNKKSDKFLSSIGLQLSKPATDFTTTDNISNIIEKVKY